MNQNPMSFVLMVVCACMFGMFVPDILIDHVNMPEVMRFPVAIVGGFAIGTFWPRSRPSPSYDE